MFPVPSDTKPDYDMLKHIFMTVYYQHGWTDGDSADYDWSVAKKLPSTSIGATEEAGEARGMHST